MAMKNKRAEVLQSVLIQIALVGLVMVLFIFATADKINARGVKQQVLEKEIALLIDSASPVMEFAIDKKNINGVISDIKLDGGRVKVIVDGLGSVKGYPFFTKYNVGVRSEGNKFVIRVE